MNREPAIPLAARPAPPLEQPLKHPLLWGTLCGMIASVGYTAANIFLRSAAEGYPACVSCDPVWVSCVKSLPTVLFAGPWILARRIQGHPVFPAPRVLGTLLLAGLIGQVFGNVFFQWSLGVIGIALTVPLTMGTVIISGAVFGRIFLHEPVTWRAAVSMSFLVLAIFVLSLGAPDAFRSVVRHGLLIGEDVAWWRLPAAIVAACLAGLAYSGLGVVIRHGVSGRSTVATTMFIIGAVGTISLGTLSVGRIGLEGILATDGAQWRDMAAAGVCNFFAFLALTKALQLTTIVYVNSLNASQVAMAAVAGVLLFKEAPTLAMWSGVSLTMVGLLMMGRRRKVARSLRVEHG